MSVEAWFVVERPIMSFGERCHACLKPLSEMRGPEIMDRQGDTYHFACWCGMTDAPIQERREQITVRFAQTPTIKTPLADAVDSVEPA